MPDESACVKGLWLIFGSTTICGKEVDNFQSNRSDSAQASEQACGFFQKDQSTPSRKIINPVRESPEKSCALPPIVVCRQPHRENVARLPGELARRVRQEKGRISRGLSGFWGKCARQALCFGPLSIRRFAAALGPSGMTPRA